MKVSIDDEAEGDLERAFEYYEAARPGLGVELVDEFRRGVERIAARPDVWRSVDDVYRRYRLHRFPYGIVYRANHSLNVARIIAFTHLSREPGWWRGRDR